MDEIYLDYDPRNAGFGFGVPGFGMPGFGMPGFGLRKQPPVLPPGYYPRAKPPVYPLPPKAQAIYYPQPQPQPQPIYYPQPVAAPDSSFRRKLSDLTVGDVVPLLAQLVIAFRPMPTPPGDEGRLETNLVNLTKFVDAIGRHFHADQQLHAAGTVAGTFLR